jgi:S-adenosylmethionine uptake transporter
MNARGAANTLPFLVACLGIATFAGMDVLMKSLSIGIGAYNALFWRTMMALAVMAPLFILRGGRWPEQVVLKLHLRRGVVTAIMAFLFFWGLSRVPLAEAIALSFIAPLIALYLAAVILGEQIGRTAVVASVVGFSGALVVIGSRLGADYDAAMLPGIAAILASAVLYAYNLILQRQQALKAGPVEIALFQNGIMLVLYTGLAPLLADLPPVTALPELAGAAALSIVSILLLSWAYARAEARILLPVEYTAFIWAALFGWLVFAEAVSFAAVLGTSLIVAGCLLAARQPRGAG